MGFQKVTSLDADITYALGKKNKQTGKADPSSVEGYYIGNREVDTKLGKTKLHIFQTPKGNIGIWGGTDMNRKLSQVALGSMARVTAAGKKPTPRGDMNVFNVEVDKENSIEVSAGDFSSNESMGDNSDQIDSSAFSDDDSDADDSESDFDADDSPRSQSHIGGLTAAQRQEKVQALLNKNKKR